MNKPRRLANLSFPKAVAATDLAKVRGGDGTTSTTTTQQTLEPCWRTVEPCWVVPCIRTTTR